MDYNPARLSAVVHPLYCPPGPMFLHFFPYGFFFADHGAPGAMP